MGISAPNATAPSRALLLSAARLEAFLNKQASRDAWQAADTNVEDPDFPTSLSSGRRLLQDQAGGAPPPSDPPTGGPPPPESASPPQPHVSHPPPQSPHSPPLSGDPAKYAHVLGLTWQFYMAQRSGKIPDGYPVKWRKDSHLSDKVPGGWYDAGDFLKLNFPLAPTVSMLAWGMLEFRDAYVASNELHGAKAALRWAVDYLYNSYDAKRGTYVGQIGDPDIDHAYWGRPEQEKTVRPAYVYDRKMAASDLLAGVSAALTSASLVFKSEDPAYSRKLLSAATSLFRQAEAKPGRYSDYYTKQTKSIYPSTDYNDAHAWAAAWLFEATNNRAYLTKVAHAWNGAQSPDVYPGWDSQWANVALFMLNLHAKGTRGIPNQATYHNFFYQKFLKAWVKADGEVLADSAIPVGVAAAPRHSPPAFDAPPTPSLCLQGTSTLSRPPRAWSTPRGTSGPTCRCPPPPPS